jgi:plasmid stabilization system protein ParE
MLAESPNLGHKRDDLPEGFKAYPAEQHVIVYQLKEETLYIARILHGSMAFKRHEID